MKTLKKLIKKHITHLKKERDAIRRIMGTYPEDSFDGARLNLAEKIWEFKIALWGSLI